MLTGGIHANYDKGVTLLGGHSGVETIARGTEDSGANRGRAALFGTTGAAFVANPALADEVFGAASIVIRGADKAEVARVLEGLEGQLTAKHQLEERKSGVKGKRESVSEDLGGRRSIKKKKTI